MNGSSGRNDSAPARAEEIFEMTRRLLIQLQQDPAETAEQRPPVTMQQLRVMRILYSNGPTRVSALARRLNVSTPTITGILDRLVRSGLSYRSDDPRDRRVVLNALTDDGRDIIENLHLINTSRLSSACESLSEEQRSRLSSALGELVEALESADTSASKA